MVVACDVEKLNFGNGETIEFSKSLEISIQFYKECIKTISSMFSRTVSRIDKVENELNRDVFLHHHGVISEIFGKVFDIVLDRLESIKKVSKSNTHKPLNTNKFKNILITEHDDISKKLVLCLREAKNYLSKNNIK